MPELISPEIQTKIAQIRARIADNTATLEDMREGIKLLRQGRHAALDAQGKVKKKSSKPSVSLSELESMLDNL